MSKNQLVIKDTLEEIQKIQRLRDSQVRLAT